MENIGHGYAPPSVVTVRRDDWPEGRFPIRVIPELFPGDTQTMEISDGGFELCWRDTTVMADSFDDVFEINEGNDSAWLQGHADLPFGCV